MLSFGYSYEPLTLDIIDALCHQTCVNHLVVSEEGIQIAGEECFPDFHGREVDSKVSEAVKRSSFLKCLNPPPPPSRLLSLSLSLSPSQFSFPSRQFLFLFTFFFSHFLLSRGLKSEKGGLVPLPHKLSTPRLF